MANGELVGGSETGRKHAVVTGDSSGIGLELTKLLAKDCYDLYLVAEDRDRLEATAAEIRDPFQVTVHRRRRAG